MRTGNVYLKGKLIPRGEDEWAVYVGNNRVDIVKKNGGLDQNNPESFIGCQAEGGMNCRTLIFKDTKNYDEYNSNNEKLDLVTTPKKAKVLK